MNRVIGALCGLVVLSLGAWRADAEVLTARVTGGQVEGVAANGIVAFKGIPFAAAPVGELRWKKPQAVVAWSGVKKTTAYAPACMQDPNMLKFIGKALNTQNDIADNIYIFDAPDLVWDDEYLNKLHVGLMKHFDLRVRFSEIEYTLRIIEDNLSVFREITNQRESSTLEWIIIALILVEVFDLIISKLLFK